MTTIAPGRQQVEPRRVSRRATAHDDDPTVYPDWEPVGREPVENLIAFHLQGLLMRHQAERGITCYVGSDAFFYWVKGDNRQSVSPDVYVLPGIPQNSHPTKFAGSKEEGCWKMWIHGVAPSFALEVKARRNPRKDELQSPPRHDALGTKELVVFDPFAARRRAPRKRFVVYRRNAAAKLVIVEETNDDRVFSEDLQAFLVAQGVDQEALLRLALGPNGERVLPFLTELVDMEARLRQEEARRAEEEARRADEEAHRADVEAHRADDAAQRAEHEARRRQEEAHRADVEARRADEATRVAQEAARRTAELEAEIARLRAGMAERPKRRSKPEK